MRQVAKRFALGTLNFVVVIALIAGTQMVLRHRVPDDVGVVIVSVVVLGGYLAGTRWIEGRKPAELADARGFGEFAAGVGLGFSLFAATMAVLWALGIYHPSGRGALAGVGTGLLVALMVAITEETLVRGFIFRLTEIIGGTWTGVVLSAVLFGAAHAFNHGATLVSDVAIALEAGVLLAAAYSVTGRLWLPIGLHLGWNFTEGSVFGMSVSGGQVKAAVIRVTLTGPDILTGGAFGPEASIVAVVLCFGLALALLRKAARTGRIVPRPWAKVKPAPLAVVIPAR